jgi:predicted permease
MSTSDERAFRRLLRLYPRWFREEHGDELIQTYRDVLRSARAQGDVRIGVWAWLVKDAVLTGLTARFGIRTRHRSSHMPEKASGHLGMGELVREMRLAMRALARAPLFTAAAVATLGLGIGATVAIFTVVNAVLLRPLAYPDADRVVAVTHHAPGWGFPEIANSPGTLNFLAERGDFFSAVAGYRSDARNLVGGPRPERVALVSVQPSIFDVLGAQPALGRAFLPSDAEEGAPPVAILTDAAWRSRFGADAAVIGRPIVLDGVTTEVVGVMPPGFSFGDRQAVALVPFPSDPDGPFGAFGIRGVARLAPGVDLEDAGRRAAELQAQLPERFPDLTPDFLEQAGWAVTVQRLQDRLVGEEVASALWVVLATVGLLLLIACANVTNLFLVRAESRQKELAVRAAMGAGTTRIASAFLGEALLLGGCGGLAGVLLAWAGVELLVARGPSSLPRLHEVAMDPASLVFAAALSVGASLVLGVLPMLRNSGAVLAPILRDGGRGATEGRNRHRTRRVLVTAQLALALMLLVGSGLMLRTFDRIRSVDPGIDPSDVLTIGLYVGDDRPAADVASFYRRVAEAVNALPGVEHVGLSQRIPIGEGSATAGSFDVEGESRAEDALPPNGWYKMIGAEYLEALRIPLVDGRALSRADEEDDAPVVLVNRTFAELLGGDVVGKAIRFGDEPSAYLRVVGVVGDVHEEGLREEVRPWAYLPLGRTTPALPLASMQVLVRMRPGTAAPVAAIRESVERIDRAVPLTSVRTMDEVMAQSLAQTSFTMVLLGVAAAVALFLGAIGLFGVISYVVGQRTREIGVRIALGAARADIRGIVFRQSAGVAAAGVVLGLVGSLALTRMMGAILFGVSARDPVTFAGAPLLLVAVAALATWLPARRAARVDPIEALRAE